MKSRHFLIALTAFFAIQANIHAQNDGLRDRMFEHVTYLASDALEGRETGTQGEQVAAEYVSGQFQGIQLKPAGTSGQFTQPFEFFKGRALGLNTELVLGGQILKLNEQWFPTVYSGNGQGSFQTVNVGYGIQAPDQQHDDYANLTQYAGKAFIIEFGSPDGVHPHSKFKGHSDVATKVELAEKMGAKAILFINHDPNLPNPETDLTKKSTHYNIPVLFLSGFEASELDGKTVQLKLDLTDQMGSGINVCGLLDNGAAKTVVIGGHFDHLGYGDHGSLHRGEKAIHNGADDNASGTAMVVELARTLQQRGPKNLNFLFIGFSGEEKGLLGSNYWVKHPTLPLENILCMVNFDMVGRLDSASRSIAVAGTGTSPFWKENLDKIKSGNLTLKTSESGVGPSDHTSFYLQNIPVLHFFTGTHADYHKPSDDTEKINFEGMAAVHQFVMELIGRISQKPELAFTKTQDGESGKAPRFSVTLGVVPDYLYSGQGMKIDGVSDGKPAQKAGLQAGDIITQLGDIQIVDMMSYMKALSQFEKGQKTNIWFLRNGKKVKKKVQF